MRIQAIRKSKPLAPPGGASSKALAHMHEALRLLDGDPAIPANIGARLQDAIDTLCQAYPTELPVADIQLD